MSRFYQIRLGGKPTAAQITRCNDYNAPRHGQTQEQRDADILAQEREAARQRKARK